MPLSNPRHEAFAQAWAKNKNASQAYADAGYRPCRQSASRLLTRADIKERVAELENQAEINSKEGRDPETGRFIEGYKGNGGRPRGSRNKLAEKFISDLHDEWRRSGVDALKSVAKDNPAVFVKVTAGILPRELDATLSVDIDLFAECRSFAQAFRLARDHIGADAPQPLMIEAEATDDAD